MYMSDYRQFDRITMVFKNSELATAIKPHAPKIVSLMPLLGEWPERDCYRITGIDNFASVFHDLGHCLDFADRGKIERIALPNFGFSNSYLTEASVKTELRTTAFEHCLEELILPERFRRENRQDLVLGNAARLLKNLYVGLPVEPSQEELQTKLNEEILRVRPISSNLLTQVDNYIYDHCRDLIGYE